MAHYFLYNSCPVRVSDDGMDAVALRHDGTERPIDAYKAVNEGHEISEAEALRYWADHSD